MNQRQAWRRVAVAVVGLALWGTARADQVVFDFERGFDAATVGGQDAKTTAAQGALRVATGHGQAYPGITLKAPQGKWDWSAYAQVAMDVRNVGTNAVTVSLRVDNLGANGIDNCVTGTITVGAGQSGTLMLPLSAKSKRDVKLFGMRGYPAGCDPKGKLDAENVTQMLVFVAKPTADHAFEIDNIRLMGSVARPAEGKAFFPFIDTFGQYVHADWPGKVHSVEELKGRVAEEAKDLAAKPGPEEWNQYGGWKNGPALKATGFFRVEKHNGKWWLVDPEGKLFWSHGIDCVRMADATPVEERETWFADYPGNKPEFAEFVGRQRYALHGYYAGRRVDCFGFAGANLKRKYGEDWRQAAAEVAHKRLRSWGMNTIANWSDSSVYLMRKTPYVCTVGSGGKMIEGSQGYWGKFPDVFDPEFAEQTKRRMSQQAARTAGDPWCIGFFVDNEMSWGDETSLAIGALLSPADQAAKKVFIGDLNAKYGTIEKLNAAWGTKHASWEAMLEAKESPDRGKAGEDLKAFYTKTAEQYFRTVKEALKAVAPNQLYLGCRFAWVNPLAVAASAKYCDVVSYNIYKRSAADFKLPIEADVPLIIGEFHFGALDRGMFHTGLVKVKDQAERAKVYREYVEGCLRHPQFVGCHWFQYQDEPTTGRVYDEENYQIGFVDIADTPYRETVEASREVGGAMYRIRMSGK